MKGIFISCNQALLDEVMTAMKQIEVRGYTSWEEVQGCGLEGEPHTGEAAWPTLKSALMVFTDDEKALKLMEEMKKIDLRSPKLGIRAFKWDVEGTF